MKQGGSRTNSFMQNLKDEGVIDQMVFSLYISDDFDELQDNSYFTAGGYDLDRFAKD